MDFRPAMQAPTGIGRYVRGLARALADSYDVALYGCFFRGNTARARRDPPAPLKAWKVPSRVMDFLARTRLYPTERVLGGIDVFHHTNFLLTPARAPQVMTVHDVAFAHEGFHAPAAAAALQKVVAGALDRCEVFCVPSPATADAFVDHFGVSRARLFVTPLGVNPEFFSVKDEPVDPPYVLAIGTLEPRKNHLRLIRAMDQLDARLVLAGGRGWMCDEVVAEAKARKNVEWVGRVSEKRLRELMAGATIVAYPSLLEGFGLPVLEAMAAGKPVLTSDRPPMSDLAGEAALLVDPTNIPAIADGLVRLLNDPGLRARLSEAGRQRARAFTWYRCAHETVRAYQAAVR